jgi:hypothetical protein
MKNYKVAVVLSGHARMVPQGNHLHQQSFYLSPRVTEWQQFSYCWTQDSEVRSPTQEQQQQFDLRDRILEGLGSRHCYADQDKMFDALCDRFIDQGALPDYRKTQPTVHAQIRYHFGKYLGQLLGFCLALDQWREELRDYDFIVRSRWDHALDPDVLQDLDPVFFYTKSINIWDGRPIVSGDNIYGSTEKWLKLIPSTEHAIRRIIQACRRLRSELAVKQPDYDFTEDYQWYTTHYLWYALMENEAVRLLHKGESFGINFELSKIPLEKLELNHAAYGIDYYYNDNPKEQEQVIPIIHQHVVHPGNIEIVRGKLQELQTVTDRRRLRKQLLEQQIKSQNPH